MILNSRIGEPYDLFFFIELCWALVIDELVRVVKYIKIHDRVTIEYSIQDTVDFINPEKTLSAKEQNPNRIKIGPNPGLKLKLLVRIKW